MQATVTGVFLGQNGLQGSLPTSAFVNLAWSLKYLSVPGNQLVGTLPKEIGKVQQLQILSLNKNQLTGTLPPALFQLPQLVSVYASLNAFTGSLPSLVNATSLAQLYLESNKLQGSLPAGWADGPAMKDFNVASNKLSGTIPPPNYAPGTLTDDRLEHIMLRENGFKGPLPATLAMMSLRELDLSSNQLSGMLPGEFDNLALLNKLDLTRNKLSGPLPRLRSSVDVQSIALGTNGFVGAIPKEWENFQQMSVLSLSINRLRGALPSAPNWPAMRLLNVYASGLVQPGDPNGTTPLLPSYLAFRTAYGRKKLPGSINCYPVVPSKTEMSSLTNVILDPFYFGSQGCECGVGYQTLSRVQGMLKCGPVPPQDTLLLIIVPACAVFLMIMLCTGYWMRKSMLQRYLLHWNRYRGPPEQGKPVTVVLTDVEGSTELWEASHQGKPVTVVLTDVEGSTELWEASHQGKPVTVVLTDAEGSTELWEASHQGKPVTVVLTDVEGSTELWEASHQAMSTAISVHDRVMRMLLSRYYGYEVTTEGDAFMLAFHTPMDAIAFCLAAQQELLAAPWPVEMLSQRTSCIKTAAQGEVTDREAAAELEPTSVLFRGLRIRMGVATGVVDRASVHELTKRVDYSGPVMDLAKAISDTPFGGQIVTDEATYRGIVGHLQEIAQDVHRAPHWDAIQSFLHGGTLQAQGDELFASMTNLSALEVQPLIPSEMAPFVKRADSSKRVMFVQRGPRASGDKLGSSDEAIQFVDMGKHILQSISEPQQLFQILVPGLEERARFYESLGSVQCLTPGYFDAPAARDAPLRAVPLPRKVASKLSAVTLVYCTVDGYHEMRAHDPTVADLAITMYVDCVRQHLFKRRGYECSLQDTGFMLAFASPLDALQFCIVVQETLLDMPWSDRLHNIPICRREVDPTNDAVFCGPRVKMCICEGKPDAIMPHEVSGHAAYMGSFVARVARLCQFAAHGGQILAGWDAVESMLREWSGTVPAVPVPGEQPMMLRQARTSASTNASSVSTATPSVNHSRRQTVVAAPWITGSEGTRRQSATELSPSPSGRRAQTSRQLKQGQARASADGAMLTSHSDSARTSMDALHSIPESSGIHSRRASASGASPSHIHISTSPTTRGPGLYSAVSGAESVRPLPQSPSAGADDVFQALQETIQGPQALAIPSFPPPTASHGHSRLKRSTGSTAIAEAEAMRPPELQIPSAGSSVPELRLSLDVRSSGTSESSSGAPMRDRALSYPGEGAGGEQNQSRALKMHRIWEASPLFSPTNLEGQRMNELLPPSPDISADGTLQNNNPVFNTIGSGETSRTSVELPRRTSESASEDPAGSKTSSLRLTDTGDGWLDDTRAARKAPRLANIVHDAVHVLHDPWRNVKVVEVHHVGQLVFRGLPQQHTVMSITSSRLSARVFPPAPPSKRAQIAAPGRGLLYKLAMEHNKVKGSRRSKHAPTGSETTGTGTTGTSIASTAVVTPRGTF
ncbi:hypothetical protein WJX72_008611 [[Myrmecia] bisecta]|uniref:Guanylate cyclase domain-containing protein n=2 Tax=[Myrmecia] bisecta TaxID=41462 RepID=A0AAW1R7Z6_9CHLO